jgi:hypothetical protein
MGYHPRWTLLEHPEDSKTPTVENQVIQIQEIQTELSHNLWDAQAAHKKAADRFRLDSSPNDPKFKFGDKVWLLRRNVKTTRPCDKLDYQLLGPFVIVDQVNDVAFHLDLPSHLHIHPVFHMSLLEPWTSSSIPRRVIPPPPPIELVDDPEFEVKAILDSKILRNKLYYLVDWLGYSPTNRTWEPAEKP